MKQSVVLFIFFLVIQSPVLIARQVFPGEMLWHMSQLVTEASYDTTITQDDIPLIITQAGTTYKLAESITYASTGTAVRIAADNVVFNLNGHTIDGLNVGEWGIGADGNSNIVIKNGFLRNFARSGIAIGSTQETIIQDVYAIGNGGIENFIIFNSTGARIEHCDSIGTSTGFVLLASSDCLINDCRARDTGTGFLLSQATHNCLINCTSQANNVGFHVDNIFCTNCSAGGCNNSFLLNCVSRENSAEGFLISGSDNVILQNCIAHMNNIGFSNRGSNRVLCENCSSTMNTTDGFFLELILGLAQGNMFLNCTSAGNTRHGFNITGGPSTGTIRNCVVLNNGMNGINLALASNYVVQSNIVSGSTIGINNTATNSRIFNNESNANTTNYVGVNASTIELVPTTSTGFWANVSQT